MEMIKGNKVILNYVEIGKELYVFEYICKVYVWYVGIVECFGYKE